MDAAEAMARLDAAPSLTPVVELGIPPDTLEEIKDLPRYGELVSVGEHRDIERRRMLTKGEVDQRLLLYLELMQTAVDDGRYVQRKKLCAAAGLPWITVKKRHSPMSESYDERFALDESAIVEDQRMVASDLSHFFNSTTKEQQIAEGMEYDPKAENVRLGFLRLIHPEYMDRRKVTGEFRHAHLHASVGPLLNELEIIGGRFELPEKTIDIES